MPYLSSFPVVFNAECSYRFIFRLLLLYLGTILFREVALRHLHPIYGIVKTFRDNSKNFVLKFSGSYLGISKLIKQLISWIF